MWSTGARLRSDCGQELDVWGGDFYTDQFYAALEHLGPQLSKLNLVHVEELDFRAVKILSLTCTNINTLGLYNCGFREPTPAEDEVRILSWRREKLSILVGIFFCTKTKSLVIIQFG